MDNQQVVISQFKDFTGCTCDDTASRLLLAHNFNLEVAIDRYFRQQNRANHSEVASVDHSRPAASGESKQPLKERRDQLVNGVRSRRVRNHGHNGSTNRPVVTVDDDDDVRAPIPQHRARLVNESIEQSWMHGIVRPPINSVFHSATDYRSIARAQTEARLNGSRHANAGGPSSSGGGQSNLQQLFRKPIDIMFAETWESARAHAEHEGLWLLVNLQNSEFQSVCLNRDIWSNEHVREIVRRNFVFWLVGEDSPDCKRVAAYYGIQNFPAVMVVDPRTGERVHSLTQLKDTVAFIEQLNGFLEENPDFKTYDTNLITTLGPVLPLSQAQASVESPPALKQKATKRKFVDDGDNGFMDAGPSSSSAVYAPAKRMKATPAVCQDADMEDIEQLCTNGTRLTTVDSEEWKSFVVPNSPEVHIILQLPNSEKKQVTLTTHSPLKCLFVFIEGQGLPSRDHILVLSFPRRVYSAEEHSTLTLADAGISRNELVHVTAK